MEVPRLLGEMRVAATRHFAEAHNLHDENAKGQVRRESRKELR